MFKSTSRLVLPILALAAASCSNAADGKDAAGTDPEQTTAQTESYVLTPVAEGLSFPWGMAFLPEGEMLVTERSGQLRVIGQDGLRAAPVAGVPAVYEDRQGGLFDVILDPDFANNRLLYLSFAKGDVDANGTALMRAKLSDDLTELTDTTLIFEVPFQKRGGAHFGGRMAFMDDGTLLLTLGDGYIHMDEAQNLSNHMGKIVRITTDGDAPADNPFVGQEGAAPEIWSYGHRSVQGLAIDPATGVVYEHEHGPKGGDEINILQPGRNYGWPVITYGINYDGTIITTETAKDGMEQPIVKWVPSIAPAGMTFYTGNEFPEWQGDLLVSALAGMQLRRVDLENGKVVGQNIILGGEERYRFIVSSPDGGLYVGTDDPEGYVYRLERQSN